MWAPDDVVPRHKKRANVIWLSFLGLIVGYAAWLFISAYEKRKDPAVSLRLEDDRYPFPTVSLCFLAGAVGYGCDTASCTIYSHTFITAAAGFDLEVDYADLAYLNEEYPYECVDVFLGNITTSDHGIGLFPPSITFQTRWLPNSTDASVEQGGSEVSESVFVFLTDPDIPDPLGNHNKSSFVGTIPYTRQVANTVQEEFTTTLITMEMTESETLDNDVTKSYFLSSISPKTLLAEGGLMFGETYDYDLGVMIIELYQPKQSHTVRKEVDPLEWAEIVGSIGGTWEILVILWGLLFVASGSEPSLEGRDLKRTAQQGVRSVVHGARTVASTIGGRSTRSDPVQSRREDEETPPSWDAEGRERARQARPSTLAPAFSSEPVAQAPAGASNPPSHSSRGQPQTGFFGIYNPRPSLDASTGRRPVVYDIPLPAARPL